MIRKICLLLAGTLLFSACEIQSNDVPEEEKSTGNPTAEEILSNYPDADIFKARGIIYSNAQDLDWVMEQDLTLGEEITEITKQSTDSDNFGNGTATELPVGTKVYDHNEGKGAIYIAVVDGQEIRYLGEIEG
ncbi:hypothetical protein [Alkalicoccus urumqiensis]|uniref:DUF3221 domain-containing protein n=1 Tax=Alkalicoccus urumqiensis TaxID=1548213 RepID=A0A2P6MDZ0_ALKUR|nr:hypothetical protein [Alkalicoccus urumqiensis]PRO64490.1 hypothetical protein C6I21_14275 [Alkalicoccus urumqiensis]